MMNNIFKVLPYFIVEYLAKRYCEKITGFSDNEKAIAQKNFIGGVRSDIVIDNAGGIINLSGDNSVAIVADYGEISNSGTITLSGDNSIALLGANGSRIENTGTIDINSSGVGIYGVNLLGELHG